MMRKSTLKSRVIMFGVTFMATFSILHFIIFPEDTLIKVGLVSLAGAIGATIGNWVMTKRGSNSK